MAKKLDKIIVIDVEATCWNTAPPQGMTNDIIEFGICLLDVHSGEISDNRGILVIPERSEISDFCTELTTITPEMIRNEGISFKEACSIIKKEYEGPSSLGKLWGLRSEAHPAPMFRTGSRLSARSVTHQCENALCIEKQIGT